MQARTAERILTWLLRIMGGAAALAFVAAVMPTSWIVAGAEMSGVGPFTDTPLTQYLVRSASVLYGMLGVLVLWVARDVRRYLEFVVFMGWLTIALGLFLTAIDFAVGMPALWGWAEGPPTVLTGVAFILLARRVEK